MYDYSSIVNFIRNIFNRTDFISLHEPKFRGNEKKYVLDTIDSTFVSSVGEYVDLFEKMMCEITGAKYAIAIVNGTNALHLSLLLAGVKQDDEVLMQPLTFMATANAIAYCNAIPHFVDVDKETLGLSPSILEKHLLENTVMKDGVCYNKNTGKRISACVPMHTFGLPMLIDELIVVCNKFNIPVIEDAAESIGSYYKSKHTGTFGLLGVFSFNGNKTVTSGGGGAIITDDVGLAKKAKHLSTQSKVPHKWDFFHDSIGYNYRMPNINAALACAQLEQLDNILNGKRKLAKEYEIFFKSIGIQKITEINGAKSNYWLNAILLKNKKERNDFLQYTNDNGIMTRPAWALINTLPMFKQSPKSSISNAEWLENRLVNLPSSYIKF